ncbi:hypothetical protein OSTOST_19529, partial [Ostertagia ostertagi]
MQPGVEKAVNSQSSKIPFSASPIVGVHVRRDDKLLKEAKFHTVEEYMTWADIYFQIQDRLLKTNVTRRVYVASDDSRVLPQIKKMYPNYEVYGNVHFAEAAKSRYNERSLSGLLSDVMMLSKCDYLVCTFSSHLMPFWAYELHCKSDVECCQKKIYIFAEDYYLRHGRYVKPYHDYYYPTVMLGWQPFNRHIFDPSISQVISENDHIAIESHSAQDDTEISLRVGDLISVRKNQHDGYAVGFNKRSGKRGIFPLYK